MFTRIRALSAGVLPLVILTAVPAAASDAVMDWNQLALAATVAAGQGAVPQTRSMAIVQVAMHDAVNAITRQYTTYLTHGAPPIDADPEAAAIAAAHTALIKLFPSQAPTTLNAARAASLGARGLTDSDPSVVFGDGVGAAVFAHRANDGAAQAQFPYVAPGAGLPGVWVTVGTATIVLPGWGNVTPWVLNRGSQFRPDAPPALDSGRYARDYEEVRELGRSTAPSARASRRKSRSSGQVHRRQSGTASQGRSSPRAISIYPPPLARSRCCTCQRPIPASRVGMRNTPTTSGGRLQPFGTVTQTGTMQPWPNWTGPLCSRRTSILNIRQDTGRTAAPWPAH